MSQNYRLTIARNHGRIGFPLLQHDSQNQKEKLLRRNLVYCLLGAVFLLLGNSAAYAVLKTSTGSGSWTTAATWSPSGVPAAGDSVVIQTGHTVTLPTSGTFPASGSYGRLTLDGTLSRGTRPMTFGSLTGSGTIASTGTTTGGFNIGSDNTSTTFAGIFTGSIGSGVAFNKYGTGTLTLTGASNYTGAGTSYIFAGTLRLGAHERLPNSAKLRLENGGSATFDLNGYNETIAVLLAPNTVEYLSDAVVTNSSVNLSTLTLSLAPSGVALGDCYGTISGNLNLVVGSSTASTFASMQLRGNNTYTGTTTVVGNGQLLISCLDPEVDGCIASLASSQVTIDGAGAKMTFLQPTTLTCNLSILNGGIAELYHPTTCYSLTLDGVAQPDGTTYGSTSSNANNQDDTHFSDIGGGALTVCSPPSSPSVGSNSPICAGTDLNLTCSAASGTTPFSYSWSGPNGFSSTDQNPTITAATTAASGTYYVTITNSCGSINTSTTATVTQPAMPALACYQTATFNTGTCSWDVTGTQPAAPTGLACYETASFNTTTCVWDVTGTQPAMPTLACYQTASFNTATCSWDVTGTPVPCISTVNVKLFLEGYYVGSSTMNSALLNQGVGLDPLVSDSIEIDLYDNLLVNVGHTKVELHTDGTAQAVFPYVNGNYYIGIKHRNTLQTWSANLVPIGLGTTNYDFSIADSQAYGSNQVEVEPGIYALFSGDINQDGAVDALDYVLLDPDIINGISGYFNTDLNGDGSVDAFDYLILDVNIVPGEGSILP